MKTLKIKNNNLTFINNFDYSNNIITFNENYQDYVSYVDKIFNINELVLIISKQNTIYISSNRIVNGIKKKFKFIEYNKNYYILKNCKLSSPIIRIFYFLKNYICITSKGSIYVINSNKKIILNQKILENNFLIQ